MIVSISPRACTSAMPSLPIVCGSITFRLFVTIDVPLKLALQAGDVADQASAIRRLDHPCTHLRSHRIGPLIQDRSRDLSGEKHGRADSVGALLHVQAMAHGDNAMFRHGIDRPTDPAD